MGISKKLEVVYSKITENKDIARYLYFTALAILFIQTILETTAFPQSTLRWLAARAVFVLLICFKIILYDHFTRKEFFITAVVVLIGGIGFYYNDSKDAIVLMIAIIGSRGIKFEDILKVFVFISLTVAFMAWLGAEFGFIEEYGGTSLKNRQLFGIELKKAYSFGGSNTTDFAARVFFTVLPCVFLLRSKSKVFFIFLLIISFALYYFTQGRLDSGCIIFLAFFGICNIIISKSNSLNLKKIWKKMWNYVGYFSIPVSALISLLSCYLYSPSIGFLREINDFSSGRLSNGKRDFGRYDINLFGREITMVGYGRNGLEMIANGAEYTFIDISYQQILLVNGLVTLVLVILAYMYISKKYKNDVYMQICIFLISINCMFAHHLLDISYIPFILAVTAEKQEYEDSQPIQYEE